MSESLKDHSRSHRRWMWLGLFSAIFVAVAGLLLNTLSRDSDTANGTDAGQEKPASNVARTHKIFWGKLPEATKVGSLAADEYTNIRREDYVGAETCRRCHSKQFNSWSHHPHRFMNAVAGKETIKGDFGNVEMNYRSGKVRFYVHAGEYRMELTGPVRRVYVVEQTVGSRHLQFYVGKQVTGPEPLNAKNYAIPHVLPMGYDLIRKRWMPATNVGWNESRFGDVVDPFYFSRTPAYHPRCITCHTTIAWGDWALKTSEQSNFPERLKLLSKISNRSFHGSQFLADAYPHRFDAPAEQQSEPTVRESAFITRLKAMQAKDLSVNLGISCEACHLGGKAHSENPKVKMRFAPSGASVMHYYTNHHDAFRRSGHNINLLCGRCHHNTASTYNAGMATYNSVEFADALSGGCYSKLNCVHCHEPHTAIGPEWSMPRAKEDSLCIKCHKEFREESAIQAHTHHSASSEASRCMNCHMPRITEGLSGMVRTHAIYSPTNQEMLKANQPNACNLCHLDKSKRWTLNHLAEWYGAKFNEGVRAEEEKKSGELWLSSKHTWTSMSAARAAADQKASWLLPQLLERLKDEYVVGRHFLESDIERMLGVSLDEMGYQFYQSKEQRAKSVETLRQRLHEAQNHK